jgi:hypothetical protein
MDVPEGRWGDLPGANDWPGDPDARVDWHVSPDGQTASFERRRGDSRVAFRAWVEGHTVYYRFEAEGLGSRATLAGLCFRTISPQFSNQERVGLGVLAGGRFLSSATMPVEGTNPFGWSVPDAPDGGNHGVVRSCDAAGWVAHVGTGPCRPSGNLSNPCMHLAGPGRNEVDGNGGKIIFFLGEANDLQTLLRLSRDELAGK